MLTGQPVDGSETALLSQFVSGFGWMSHIGVVNSGGIGQELTLTAYQDDGELWDGATNPARLPLEANEAIRFGVGELFGFPPSELRSGWIEVEATLGPVSTFIGLGYGTVPSFALVSGTDLAKASNLVTVANFVDGETFFTGLTMNNPGVLDATVDVVVLRDNGTTLGKATVSIPARETHARLFGDLVTASVGQGGVWAFVSSDQPIVAAALMGTTDGLSLANVNPQPSAVAFNPPAQTTAAITGSVTQGNRGSPGVTIALEGPVHGSTTTDGSGRFAFTDLLPGSYAVRPSAAGATFAPVERSVDLALVNVDRIDFESGGVVPAELPELDAVSPSATFEGNTTLNLRVLGSNFTPASVLQINGVSAPTIFVSSTELNAVLPEEQTAQAADLTLSVLTAPPGGGSVAFIRNLNPKSIGAGEAGIVIIVRGDGFTPSAEVVLLGTFVGATGERLNLPLELAVGTEFIDERTLSFELPFAGENGSPIGIQVWNSLDSRSNVAIIEVSPRNQGSGDSGNQGQGNAGDDDDSSPGNSGNQGQGGGNQGGGNDDSGEDESTGSGNSGGGNSGGSSSGGNAGGGG